MYYRAEQILSAYPKEFTGNMKGRGSLLCTDREGIYLLKEYTGSVHRLELLEEVQRTGDIFFPARWCSALLSSHRSPEAYREVKQFLADHPDYPQLLRNKILNAAYMLYRANGE